MWITLAVPEKRGLNRQTDRDNKVMRSDKSSVFPVYVRNP